jgi:hypothetical protein
MTTATMTTMMTMKVMTTRAAAVATQILEQGGRDKDVVMKADAASTWQGIRTAAAAAAVAATAAGTVM